MYGQNSERELQSLVAWRGVALEPALPIYLQF